MAILVGAFAGALLAIFLIFTLVSGGFKGDTGADGYKVPNIVGMTVEEALVQVDLFLDGAQMNSLKTVTIIHGKGTGALRAGIHSHLKRHPGVAEFRLGRYGEGEDGVTIVTLK